MLVRLSEFGRERPRRDVERPSGEDETSGRWPMHWRYRLRKQQLLHECEIPPEVFQGGVERLADFARPFAECLGRREQRDHARTYLAGLVSDLNHKTAESIAYRHDQQRHGLQHFVGSSTWDHRPLLRALAGQVGREIGTPDGVIVFDPSGFPKKGDASVGVQRQWLGRLVTPAWRTEARKTSVARGVAPLDVLCSERLSHNRGRGIGLAAGRRPIPEPRL